MAIIETIVTGLTTVLTTFVPAFFGAVVEGAEALFIGTGEGAAGTIVLGIFVTVAGVALVTSLLRLVMRILRLKRRA